MSNLNQKLKRLAAFDEARAMADIRETWDDKPPFEIHPAYFNGGRIENARLQPLIEALIAVAEASKDYAYGKNMHTGGAKERLEDALTALEKLSGDV